MALNPVIIERLQSSGNEAVEKAVAAAMASASADDLAQLAGVLLARNRRAGWVTLVRHFDRLPEALQMDLLQRPRELFGPLSEAIGEAEGSGRANVIAIVRKAADPKLISLLTEALSDGREQVRQLAAESLLEAIRAHRAAVGSDSDEHPAADPEDLRRAIDFAVRQFKTHRQEAVVMAALLLERQLEAPLWQLFHDSYDHATRAANNVLRQPGDPLLASARLLALCSALKPAAVAGITFCASGPSLQALAAASFRLVDPVLRGAAANVPHPRAMAAPRVELDWQAAEWGAWLRLIDGLSFEPSLRLAWLSRLLELVDRTPHAAPAKLMILQAIGQSDSSEATMSLLPLTCDPDERVARSAARLLMKRRPADWKAHAAVMLQSPHASVRKLVSMAITPGQFERLWHDYHNLPTAVQVTTARAMATTDAQFPELLRSKLTSSSAIDVAQGLRMLGALKSLAPYRDQIIALCGHPDAKVTSSAVHLVGRLEDPRLKDLLEAAARHHDPRVRSNAVEAMEHLHVADKSQQVLAMLHSRFNRERATAIRAISSYNFDVARECLLKMLDDPSPHHRISALWVVSQLNLLELVRQVASLARRDPNMRVRARAQEMLDKFEEIAVAVTL